MADTNPRILQLLEEVLDSERTPEEVCAECPELLEEVRSRLARHRQVEAHLAAVFPVFDLSAARKPAVAPGQHLPAIPGYEIQGVLGRGGMGVVYAARHLRLDRLVALKMLLAGVYAAPQEVARFAREAAVIAGLQHEHIIRVYDVSEFDGRPYFTMELIEGGSLAQRLAGEPQSPTESAALMEKLACAVQVAHESASCIAI